MERCPALQDVDFWVRVDTEGEREFGNLHALLQPYFPAWQDNLRLSAHAFQDGTYIFKVSLGRVWRRIAVQGRHDFATLSAGILDAFAFDDDHLTLFHTQTVLGRAHRFIIQRWTSRH